MEVNNGLVVPRLSTTPVIFTDELFNELRDSVKGPVCRPLDAEYVATIQ